MNNKTINEESQSAKPEEIVLINEDITNLNTWENSFTAVPDNGDNISIVVKNSDQTDIVLVVWIQGTKEKRVEMKKQEEVTLNFNVLSEDNYRVQIASADGQGPFSASIRARQF